MDNKQTTARPYKNADRQADQNDVAQKIVRFKQYLAVDANNRDLWLAYGDLLHVSGQLSDAKNAFEKMLELTADDTVAQSRLASLLISSHDFAAAEEMLKKLIEGETADSALQFNLGLALYHQLQFEKAIVLFAELTAVDPVADSARYYLISCLHNLERNDEAIQRATEFLQERPTPKLRGYLALVQWDALALEDALAQANAVLREEPDNVDAAAVIGTYCIEQQRMDEAEQHLQRVTQREPNNIRGWQGLSLIALYRQQYAEAIAHIKKALEHAPDDVGNYNTLGWIYIITQQFIEAEQTFCRGLEIDRNAAEAHGGLAAALAYQNKIDAAKREIELACGLDKRCFGAQVAQSRILQALGQSKLAQETFANMLNAPLRGADTTLMDSLIHYRQKTKRQ
jgi:tetratricopeptide (TPR) repeat protein